MELKIGAIITLTNSDKIIELDAAKKLYEYNGYKLEMLDWGHTFRVIGYADYAPDEPLPFDEPEGSWVEDWRGGELYSRHFIPSKKSE